MEINYGYRKLRENLTDWDKCVTCHCKAEILCDSCLNTTCMSSNCCTLFPNKDKTNIGVCNNCYSNINKKLKVVVNHDQLVLLKKKIQKKIEEKIEENNE